MSEPVVDSARAGEAAEPRPSSPWSLALRRFARHRAAMLAAVSLVAIGLACVGVGLVVGEEESLELNYAEKLEPPSLGHPFGTDELGRDQLVRCLYGGRVSLAVGAQAMLIALTLGTLLGAIAGLRGGLADAAIMRLVDLFLAVPVFFVLLLLASYYGSDLTTVTAVIGLTAWMEVCRLVRAEILTLREKEFIEAARALGVGPIRLLARHILPNAAGPIVVAATLGVARAIIVESALSYLGFGVQPPASSWGSMLRNAQSQMMTYTWLAIFPGLLIFVTVLAFNFVGDGLRDALDPRVQRR